MGAADALLGMRREGYMHGQSLFDGGELRDNRKQGQKVKVMPNLYDGTGNWGDYLTHFNVKWVKWMDPEGKTTVLSC